MKILKVINNKPYILSYITHLTGPHFVWVGRTPGGVGNNFFTSGVVISPVFVFNHSAHATSHQITASSFICQNQRVILNGKLFPPTWKSFLSFPLILYRRSSEGFLSKTCSQNYSFSSETHFSQVETIEKDGNGNAEGATILSGHMDSIFKEKEASFLNPCPQRSLLWDLHPLLFSYLLYPSHQDSAPSTLPPGLSLFSSFRDAHLFFFFNWV